MTDARRSRKTFARSLACSPPIIAERRISDNMMTDGLSSRGRKQVQVTREHATGPLTGATSVDLESNGWTRDIRSLELTRLVALFWKRREIMPRAEDDFGVEGTWVTGGWWCRPSGRPRKASGLGGGQRWVQLRPAEAVTPSVTGDPQPHATRGSVSHLRKPEVEEAHKQL